MDSWIGSSFCGETLLLYDEGHWFDFQQAAIFSKFFLPETRYQRCKPMLDKARNAWLFLDGLAGEIKFQHIVQYVYTLENLGNIIAGLVSFPLPLRRFGLHLPENASTLGKPGLAAGLFDLYSPVNWETFQWPQWIADWQTLFQQISTVPDCPADFQPFRIDYYLQPMYLLQEENPEAGLWISLKTMLDGWAYLKKRKIKPEIEPESMLSQLNLTKNNFPQRLDEMDTYLDALEITVEEWATNQGILL
jgi:hypothetical protein